MTPAILSLAAVSFVVAWAVTFAMRRIAPRFNFVDRPGHRKVHRAATPLGGGVGIFLGFAIPLLLAVWVVPSLPPTPGSAMAESTPARQLFAALQGGIVRQRPMALGLVGAMLAMHLLGLRDDRRAMGPFSKLFVQLAIVAAFVAYFDVRALTVLDKLHLGRLPSIVVTVLWITAISNAFNFLDNMDGLSAGVAAVCTAAFLVAAVSIQQWFVAAALALLLGALLGFLCFNFPPASIFMGDAGSLVIGLVLGVLTVRTTFLRPGEEFGAGWYALFAPLIVLAVPLYDLVVVSAIRMSRGKSPFVGDTNHFSHRLVARGMSRRTAVLCIYLVTAATAVAAVILAHAHSSFVAVLVFGQTVLILGVVALLEQHPLPKAPTTSAELPAGNGEIAETAPVEERPQLADHAGS
jgi:UDP-GlcNAc:undecaprenyl-phosphate GlcNAc-1-phosphate transferase